MEIKINGNAIAEMPMEFTVTTLDIDNGETTTRTANGVLNRDRVAVKRQIEMKWNAVSWSTASALLQSMSDVFFDVYYPDPMLGTYTTKTFYVGNRVTPVAKAKGNEIYWNNLRFTLTEK